MFTHTTFRCTDICFAFSYEALLKDIKVIERVQIILHLLSNLASIKVIVIAF